MAILADPDVLRRDLRQDESDEERRRRNIVALSLVGIGALGLTTLLQTGVVRHLPDPPIDGFDSDKVNLSETAWKFGAPDGAYGVTSFAVNLPLAAFGAADRAETQPLVPLLAAAKAGGDALVSAWLLWDMPAKQKAWCGYCIVASLANFGVFALTLPEAKRALDHWGSRGSHEGRI